MLSAENTFKFRGPSSQPKRFPFTLTSETGLFYGAVIGNTVTVASGGTIMYDRKTSKMAAYTVGKELGAWADFTWGESSDAARLKWAGFERAPAMEPHPGALFPFAPCFHPETK